MKKETIQTGYFILDWVKLIVGISLVGYFTFYRNEPGHLLSIIGGFIIALSNVRISFSKKR